MTQIFYVRDDYDPNNDRSLFVEATDVKEAVAIWRSYYEADGDDMPVKVYNIPAPSGRSLALEWYAPGEITVAWPPTL